MATREPSLTLGLEEGYLLVDRATGAVASAPPVELFIGLNARTAGRAFPEFLRSQVEIVTPVRRSVAEARQALTELRAAVIEVAVRRMMICGLHVLMSFRMPVFNAVRLAALNQCLIRALYRMRLSNQRWRSYPLLLVGENPWRAMRYSFDSGLLDLGPQQIRPCAELPEELIELVRDDAEALDCRAEIAVGAWLVAETARS